MARAIATVSILCFTVVAPLSAAEEPLLHLATEGEHWSSRDDAVFAVDAHPDRIVSERLRQLRLRDPLIENVHGTLASMAGGAANGTSEEGAAGPNGSDGTADGTTDDASSASMSGNESTAAPGRHADEEHGTGSSGTESAGAGAMGESGSDAGASGAEGSAGAGSGSTVGYSASQVASPSSAGTAISIDTASGAPQALGSESDIYCSGFLGDPDQSFEFHLLHSEVETLAPRRPTRRNSIAGRWGTVGAISSLTNGDIVYLDGGRTRGVVPASVYTVVQPRQIVHHPTEGYVVGRYYSYLGRVRVLSVQDDSAIAEIVDACDAVYVGSGLIEFVPEPVPLARRTALRPVNLPATETELASGPVIVHADAQFMTLGQGSVVYIDHGALDNVAPGDLYTIYRLNRKGLPPVVLGELAVLSVHDSTSVARILESRHQIKLGDRLDLK